MEKKKMTNKKKFWIGMSSLAAVGVIAATVAYFGSRTGFNPDKLKALGYSVTAQKLLDTESAKNMYNGKQIDADVTVENNGDMPVLTRITYNLEDKDASTSVYGAELTNTTLKPLVPSFYESVEGNKFGYLAAREGKGEVGCYYYKGMLNKDGIAKHLKTLALTGYDDTNSNSTFSVQKTDGQWTSENIGSITEKKGEKSVYTYSGLNKELQVVVETIQATDKDGALLTEDNLKDNGEITAEKVRDAWDNLTNF